MRFFASLRMNVFKADKVASSATESVGGCFSALLRSLVVLWIFCEGLILCPIVGRAQQPSGKPPMMGRLGYPGNDIPATDPVLREKQVRALNEQRQKQMVSDAEKLLELARALHAAIGAQPDASLTADQIRTIERIEKLARSVKDKMSFSVVDGLPPQVPDATRLPFP